MSVHVHPGLRRRVTTLMAAGGLLLSACGSPEPTTATELDAATAAVLADAADRLGAALDDDDHCRALAEADALEDRVRVAGESGDAPDDVLRETLRVAATLTADLRCEPAEPEDAEEEVEPDADPAPDPGEAEIEAPAEAEGPSGGGGPPDDAGGPDGPPGQDRGQGRGQSAGEGDGNGPGSGNGRGGGGNGRGGGNGPGGGNGGGR